jgi:hypothetical protein
VPPNAPKLRGIQGGRGCHAPIPYAQANRQSAGGTASHTEAAFLSVRAVTNGSGVGSAAVCVSPPVDQGCDGQKPGLLPQLAHENLRGVSHLPAAIGD